MDPDDLYERFDSSASDLVVPASHPSTDPCPGPHEAETWPPSEPDDIVDTAYWEALGELVSAAPDCVPKIEDVPQ